MTAPNQPTFTQPSQNGELSQKYGSTAETFVARATSPVGNPVGQIRAQEIRQSDGLTIWDSGWVGHPVTQPIPNGVGQKALVQGKVNGSGIGALPQPLGATSAQVYSARAAGKTLGDWARGPYGLPQPTPYGAAASGALNQYAIAVLTVPNGNTYVYLIGGFSTDGYAEQSTVYYATLNEDGSIGSPWTLTAPLPVAVSYAAAAGVWQHRSDGSNAAYIYVSGGYVAGVASAGCYVAGVNTLDGSIVPWEATSSLNAARTQHGMVFWNNFMYVFGGNPTSATCERSVVNAAVGGDGLLAAWSTSLSFVSNMSANLYSIGWAAVPDPNTGNLNLIVCGGYNGSANQTTVQHCRITQAGVMGTWSTTTALPSADSSGSAAIVVDNGVASIFYTRGIATFATYAATVTLSTGAVGAWNTGASSGALATGQMGTGGTVATDPSGVQTLTYQRGNLGTAAAVNPAAGDVTAATVQVTDNVTGAVSALGAVGVRYGDAPTISGLAATPSNNGQPSIAFAYVQGAGGRPPASWRLTVTRSGVTYADSGVVAGTPPASWQPIMNPPLSSTLAYTITATITSLDVAYPGSTDTATATATYTPTLTPPAAPSGLVATTTTPSSLLLSWTNGTGTTGNRFWARPHGTTAWTLLASVAGGSGAQTQELIGLVALNAAYDLAVTSYNSNNAETQPSAATLSNVTVVSTTYWLRDAVNAPTAPVQLQIKPGTFTTAFPESLTEHKPLGRPASLVIADVVGLESGQFTARTVKASDEPALLALLVSQTTLRLSSPDGREWNIRITSPRPTATPNGVRSATATLREHAITWVGQ